MIFRNLLLFIIISGSITCAFGVETVTIAILELQVRGGLSEYEAAILTDKVRESLYNTGRFTVLDRSSVDDILKELGFSQSGCTTNECIISVGRMLSAKYMVIGSVGTIGSTYNLALKMIDVETGTISNIATLDCEEYTIEQFAADAPEEIVKKLISEQGTEFQTKIKPKKRSFANESKLTINAGHLFASDPLLNQVGIGYKISSRFLLKFEFVNYFGAEDRYYRDFIIVIGPRYFFKISKKYTAFSQITLGYFSGWDKTVRELCFYPGVGINAFINDTISLEVSSSYLFRDPAGETNELYRDAEYTLNVVFSL